MSKSKYYLALVIVCIIWGATPACGRMLSLKVSPVFLTAMRFFFMSLVLFAFVIASGRAKDLKPCKRDFLIMGLMGMFGVFLHNSLLMTGLQYTTASNTAMIESIGPTVTCVLAFFIVGERLSLRGWLGILISCLGALSIVSHGSFDVLLGLNFNKGDLIIVVCEAMWSCYTVTSWFLSKNASVAATTAWSSFIGAMMCFAYGFALNETQVGNLNMTDYFAFAYLVMFSGVIAFLGWNWAAVRVGVSKAGTFVYVVPFAGAITGYLLLGEELFVSQFVGGAVVILGMIITTRSKLALKTSKSSDTIVKYKAKAKADLGEK